MKRGLVLMGVLLLSFLFLASCIDNEKEEWIVGFWVTEATFTPHSDVVEISADGTYSVYDNYACSGAPVVSGTWSLEGDVLTYDGTTTTTITKVSNNEWYEDSNPSLYRKGTEPGGSIFDQLETELTAGNWTDGDLPIQHTMKLYSFTSSSAGNYTVSWEDMSDGGSYTGDVNVSAYGSDQATELFYDHNGVSSPQTVALGATEKIFIIVEASFSGGTYRIKVQ